MATEAQINANRANALKSRGPITAEGKARSAANAAFSTGPRTAEGKARASRNAVKHGILADSILVVGENHAEFIAQLDRYKERYKPIDDPEERAIERLVFAEWRQHRLWTMEMGKLSEAIIEQQATEDTSLADRINLAALRASRAFGHLADNTRSLDLVLRYETMLRRQIADARKEIRQLKAEREERIQEQVEEMEASLENEDFVTPSESAGTERTDPNSPMHVHSCNSSPSNPSPHRSPDNPDPAPPVPIPPESQPMKE